jgi:hypothetical protein
MALGNIILRSTSSSSVVNLKANVDATIDIVNRPLTHEEVDLNFLEIGASVKANLIGNFSTSDLTEGTNKYFTDARVGTYLTGTAKIGDISDVTTPTASDDKYHMFYDHSSASIKFGDFSNSDKLPEGSSNLYFTNARADSRIAAATTDDLSEGSSNKYYTDARWDTRLGTKTTANLTEGSNLYFTNARADARADVRIAASSINTLSDVDTTGIATNKILKWTGSNWTIADSTSTTLTGLTDTTISGATNGQVLKYNGTAWVNGTDINNAAFDGDLKANVLTSSTTNVKASTIANKNIILDLNANASIVGNSATAVGDVISSAYLNTTTNIATAVNMSDLIIEGDLLSGVTLKNNSNNANVTNVGANLSAYHYNKTGEPGFNISLFDDSHSVHDSYIKAKANGFQWQFKVANTNADATGDTRQTIFAGDTRGTITYESRAYDNLRRYSASLSDAVAYGPVNANYTAKDLTLTASGELKFKPTGKLDIGSTPGHWDATTQARIQKMQSYFSYATADNTKRHYNQAYGNKITFSANTDSANRKQGLLVDTRFDLAGFTFGADSPTSLYRMLGNYDWTNAENTGSATTLSGIVGRHISGGIDGGSHNITATNVVGILGLANLDDSTSSTTNLIGVLAHTGNDNGTATNRYSIYAPEANDKAYFAGPVQVGAWTLPIADGSANQVLKTNGSGTVTWQADSAGTSFDAETITANGSTNSASPTALTAGKSAYIWARSYGNSSYFSLPDGTTIGQRTILIGRAFNSGSNVQIKYTGYQTGNATANMQTSVDTVAGNNNKEMLWDGSAWYFLGKQ